MNIDFFLFSLILGIFLNLFFGFFIIFKNPFNSSARWLLAFSLVNFAWVVSSYLAVFYQGEETTIWILRTVIFLAIWQGFTLNFFVKIYPQKKYKYLNLELYIVTPATVLVSLFCFTEYYFKSVELLDGLYQPVPGLFIPVFAFYSILLVAYGIYVLAKKLWLNPQSRDLKFIFTGVLLMFSSIIVLNFILPIFFNINNFIGFSAIFTLPFVVFASYGILKDSTYDLKTITTEIFVYLYWGMTFFFIFLTEGILAKTFVTFLFLASIVLGILIIKSVRKEVDEKDRVIKLNKEVEQQKKEIESQKQTLQDLLTIKDETLHIVNHQINTPISVMRGAIDMFKDKLWDSDKLIFTLQKEMVRVKETISLFLSARKYENGVSDLKKIKTEVVTLVDSIIAEKKLLKKVRDDSMQIIFDKKVNVLEVGLDVSKIKEVISNLLDNAISYSKKDVVVGVESGKGGFTFSIKDSGIGISKENIGKLFSRFTRLDNAKNTRPDGTGLGLYVCKQIIEAHGGQIWVESAGEGKGSTFFFTLPLS